MKRSHDFLWLRFVFLTVFGFHCRSRSLVLGFSHPTSTSAEQEKIPIHHFRNPKDDAEIFSVAPMMGHTHRHFRHFFGQISERAWLYTEMIPTSRIVQAFVTATGGMEQSIHNNQATMLDPDWILEHVERIKFTHQLKQSKVHDPVLEELLNPGPNPSVLQLGGRDPVGLANAAAIGTAFGFRAINLNCGCPSTSVAARATGAALMREPDLVSSCLEVMSKQMDQINPTTILSVKHRLGVKDAESYNAEWDRIQDDQEAYESCRSFVKAITTASKVSRLQVHARIALLGVKDSHNTGGEEDRQDSGGDLWSPSTDSRTQTTIDTSSSENRKKVNHKRVQYQAKRRSRQVTLANRSVPPLRPKVVDEIAQEFAQLQISSNGGIDCMEEIHHRLNRRGESSITPVVGAMVGRAVINHPCSFAAVDEQLWGKENDSTHTRRKVLSNYIDYCQQQEILLQEALGDTPSRHGTKGKLSGKDEENMNWHRRRLISPIFHLFVGEEGNERYQRRLCRFVERADRHSTYSMTVAAMAEIPNDVLDKPIQDHIPTKDIPTYDYVKRSGAMQRTIY